MSQRDEISWSEENGQVGSGVRDVSDQLGTPALLIADQPDWVRAPSNLPIPELAGQKIRVLSKHEEKTACSSCGVEGTKTVLVLEEGLQVVACRACGSYSWMRQRK